MTESGSCATTRTPVTGTGSGSMTEIQNVSWTISLNMLTASSSRRPRTIYTRLTSPPICQARPHSNRSSKCTTTITDRVTPCHLEVQHRPCMVNRMHLRADHPEARRIPHHPRIRRTCPRHSYLLYPFQRLLQRLAPSISRVTTMAITTDRGMASAGFRSTVLSASLRKRSRSILHPPVLCPRDIDQYPYLVHVHPCMQIMADRQRIRTPNYILQVRIRHHVLQYQSVISRDHLNIVTRKPSISLHLFHTLHRPCISHHLFIRRQASSNSPHDDHHRPQRLPRLHMVPLTLSTRPQWGPYVHLKS